MSRDSASFDLVSRLSFRVGAWQPHGRRSHLADELSDDSQGGAFMPQGCRQEAERLMSTLVVNWLIQPFPMPPLTSERLQAIGQPEGSS